MLLERNGGQFGHEFKSQQTTQCCSGFEKSYHCNLFEFYSAVRKPVRFTKLDPFDLYSPHSKNILFTMRTMTDNIILLLVEIIMSFGTIILGKQRKAGQLFIISRKFKLVENPSTAEQLGISFELWNL
jgi:hypothetical protein